MKRLTVVVMVCSFVMMAFAVTPKARAQHADNNKTTITFSAPYEVPGVEAQVLPAGTYVFKLLDSLSDRNIVQIFSADEKQLFATILAIPNFRIKSTDKTVLTFGERPAGVPEAIKAWFYPGERWGQEFVYPKRRAIELAKLTNAPVLAMPVETAAAPVETLKTVRLEAVQPTGEVVPVTAVVELPPAAEREVLVAQAQPVEALPATASALPLVALMGLLSLCASFALLIVSKRAA